MKRTPAVDRLLKAANDLFYKEGIRAVGVDQVVGAAGVAKISLYRAFASKDELIVAYLRQRDEVFWRGWDDAVAGAVDPKDRLRAILALLRSAIIDPDYRGCPLANFTAEFPGRDHAGRGVVNESRRELRTRLADICGQMNVREPGRLANGIGLLVEGAFSASQTTHDGSRSVCDTLEWSVEALLASQAWQDLRPRGQVNHSEPSRA